MFLKNRFKGYPIGTHYWHSHGGLQRSDGFYGAFIVREPNDPHAALYNDDLSEHVILVRNWMYELAIDTLGCVMAVRAIFRTQLL